MLTSHELIGFMSPDLAGQILSFAFEADKPLYRSTLNAVAGVRKVRPVFLERQPRPQRQAAIIASLSRPALENAAAGLIRIWLVKKQAAMLVLFLDTLGIPHKEGVVDDLPPSVEDEKLRAAVEALLAKFPREEVAVYLVAFHDMNEVTWPTLKTMLESDPRLQLGNHS